LHSGLIRGETECRIRFRRHVQKLGKTTISCVMSVRPHGTVRLPIEGFSWKFKKIQENSNLVKIGQNNRNFTWRPIYIYFRLVCLVALLWLPSIVIN